MAEKKPEKYKLKIVPEPMKNTAFRGGDFCRKFRTVIFFCFSGKSLYLRQSAQFLGIILAGNIYDTDA